MDKLPKLSHWELFYVRRSLCSFCAVVPPVLQLSLLTPRRIITLVNTVLPPYPVLSCLACNESNSSAAFVLLLPLVLQHSESTFTRFHRSGVIKIIPSDHSSPHHYYPPQLQIHTVLVLDN